MINFACSKKDTSPEIEQKIIEDTFVEIFEYTFQDFRKSPPPLPPPPAPKWTDEEWKKHFEDYKKHLDTLIFRPLYIIVNDSALGIPKTELKRMFEEDNQKLTFIDTTVFKKSFKIDLENIDLGKDFILKHSSDFSQNIGELVNYDRLKYDWKEEKHLRQFSGMLSFSRFYFNKEQNYGFMYVSFNCGKLCGCSYMVFVKKTQNKWVIDKIENLGCA